VILKRELSGFRAPMMLKIIGEALIKRLCKTTLENVCENFEDGSTLGFNLISDISKGLYS